MSIGHTAHRWLRLFVPSLGPSFVAASAPLHAWYAMPAPEAGLHLEQGGSARLGVAQGRTLCCLAGSAWITHDGDPKDIVIDAGESYYVASRERTIVHALRDCRLRVL